MSEESYKVEPFFHKLSRLAADVEYGVKKAQKKLSLPKSDLPENSALIASTQLLDSFKELKKNINATEDELSKTECDMENFMDSFQDAVKDTSRKLDELENVLAKYGYVPWKPPQETMEPAKGASHTGDVRDTVPDCVAKSAIQEINSAAQTDKEKPSNERSSTPVGSSCAVRNVLHSCTNRIGNYASRYNSDGATPQLRLRTSCRKQPCNQLTPACFSDDVVCTPGLFIQKKCLKNGTLVSPNYRSFFPSQQYMNETENVYKNVNPHMFCEKEVKVALFQMSSYTCQKQKESVTPEEPVIHQLLEDFQKIKTKNIGFQNRTPRRDNDSTPESPKLTTFAMLEKSKTYQSLLNKKC